MYGTELALSPATTKSSMSASLGDSSSPLGRVVGEPTSRSIAPAMHRCRVAGSGHAPNDQTCCSRPAGAEPPLTTTTTERSLAGYRLLRRISNGDRADVYLATVDRAENADDDAPLVAVRVYAPTVPGESIATEIEAMAADTSGALPELFDVAALDDGRCCLAVERMPGPTLGEPAPPPNTRSRRGGDDPRSRGRRRGRARTSPGSCTRGCRPTTSSSTSPGVHASSDSVRCSGCRVTRIRASALSSSAPDTRCSPSSSAMSCRRRSREESSTARVDIIGAALATRPFVPLRARDRTGALPRGDADADLRRDRASSFGGAAGPHDGSTPARSRCRANRYRPSQPAARGARRPCRDSPAAAAGTLRRARCRHGRPRPRGDPRRPPEEASGRPPSSHPRRRI